MLSDQRVLDVKTSRVPEKTSQLTDWSFWDHSRLPLAGANASLEIQARLFQKWILITTILHPPHFANSSLYPPRFKLLTLSLRVKVVTSQFIRRKSFFLGFIQADIGNLVNYSLSFNNLSLNNNFGLTGGGSSGMGSHKVSTIYHWIKVFVSLGVGLVEWVRTKFQQSIIE